MTRQRRLTWALGASLVGLALSVDACRTLEPRATDDAGAGSSSSSSGAASSSGNTTGSSSGGSSSGSTSSSSSSSSSGEAPPPFDGGPILAAGDHAIGPSDRLGTLTVPTGYAGEPMPLVLLLHGTGESQESVETFLQFKPTANSKGLFLLRATARKNQTTYSAWNATDSCCMYAAEPDDSAYLTALLETAQSQVAVDAKRIYVVGHSSGGFMAYRMACDHADLVAGIVSLAGGSYDDVSRCTPSAKVSVLQIHGDQDTTVAYGGGAFYWYAVPYPYPGAKQSVADWAAYNGCASTLTASGTRELVNDGVSDETNVSQHADCPAGGAAELWTLTGAGHTPGFASPLGGPVPPAFDPTFSAQVADWLLARPKP